MAFSLEKIWSKLHAEEALLEHWEKRSRICRCTVGIVFVVLAWLGAFLNHFSFAACFAENQNLRTVFPISILWNTLGDKMLQDPEDSLLLGTMISISVVLIGTATASLVVRLALKNTAKKTVTDSPTKSLHTALKQAEELQERWKVTPPKFPLAVFFAAAGVVAVATVSTRLCMGGVATDDDVSNNLFAGMAFAIICLVSASSVKKWSHCPKPNKSQVTELVNEISRQLEKENQEKQGQ